MKTKQWGTPLANERPQDSLFRIYTQMLEANNKEDCDSVLKTHSDYMVGKREDILKQQLDLRSSVYIVISQLIHDTYDKKASGFEHSKQMFWTQIMAIATGLMAIATFWLAILTKNAR